MELTGKTVLITGSARRLGKSLALSVVRAGGDVIIHHGHSLAEAEKVLDEIKQLGGKAAMIQQDISDLDNLSSLIQRANSIAPLYAVVNNAAIFESVNWKNCDLATWNRHLDINLTAPFLISQAFASNYQENYTGRIINIVDWRALRPGESHLPYTISKAGLVALTKSLAISLAPKIIVNGLALGAILPPSDGANTSRVLEAVPAGRWAELSEVEQALIFLLTGPEYITGEIIHVDGGRHLV
jgi:NAD(P)-dependent dehydrogenase (short-subunit alcohol dehydrogenase family)